MSCVLGFDVGSKMIGVAVGNRITQSARALATVPMRDGQPDWQMLDRLQREWMPAALVVGLPLTLEGSEQPASKLARRFASALAGRYGTTPLLVDERHSSQEAAGRFASARASGVKRRRDGAHIDAEAAAVILERWLLEAGTASAP
ncbi:Holliday junction resolvase RuvX [Dyella sp.]|jgi:putative Holliday junction resolvase|uniref:Holliday junction resolvase RuvX n=1 Tax=Dyella sp. TaxID=1869338 RepID=UPI002D78E566|nr:Holliday junction resolvase RuvX [Dyella sp.]HET6433266.1 Holliday junction resolvase RuvX [Dyella sp.]